MWSLVLAPLVIGSDQGSVSKRIWLFLKVDDYDCLPSDQRGKPSPQPSSDLPDDLYRDGVYAALASPSFSCIMKRSSWQNQTTSKAKEEMPQVQARNGIRQSGMTRGLEQRSPPKGEHSLLWSSSSNRVVIRFAESAELEWWSIGTF